MSGDTIFALLFIAFAFIGYTVAMLDYTGVFDQIAFKITDLIVKRIERLEGKDI